MTRTKKRVNGGNQGVASEPILFTMPSPVATAAVAEVAPLLKAIVPNGKSDGNGNGSQQLAVSRIN